MATFDKKSKIVRRKRIYVDMDGVLADFDKKIMELFPEMLKQEKGSHASGKLLDYLVQSRARHIFLDLEPVKHAKQAFDKLCKWYDVYILSTPMWDLPESYTDKRVWVQMHLGENATKKLILSHDKNLLVGDYIVDDRLKHGVDVFGGKHFHFGTQSATDWPHVLRQLSYLDNWELDEMELFLT